MKDLKLADGRDRLVRHSHGPERAIQTGIGPVEVSRVKIRDREVASDGERIRFTSAILSLWAEQLLNGTYKPKPGGNTEAGWRRGSQALQRQWDPTFSKHSYGF